MDNDFSNLLRPIQIGELVIKNRIEASATGMPNKDMHNMLTRELIAYYALKAKGGAGLVTVGESCVAPSGSTHKMVFPGDPLFEPNLAATADAIHQYGAAASQQICHGGGQCNAEAIGMPPLAPSVFTNRYGQQTYEMTQADIEEIAHDFGRAALGLKTAGFDMVQLHSGHGWLLGQFMSPFTNKRKDQFGGSAENRLRFTLMCIDQIRSQCGAKFPIEIRISGDECFPGGYGLDEGIQFARILDGLVDIIHVSAGSTFAGPFGMSICSPLYMDEQAQNHIYAQEIKKRVKTPVATVGGISDPHLMEELISSGKADMVAVARALIADPYLPAKLRQNRVEDVRPCLRCLNCLDVKNNHMIVRCDVNPVIGRELEYDILPPPCPSKKVLVIGGGPGGMEAAIMAARRGHSVTLCEKSGDLGGLLAHADKVPFKKDLLAFREYLKTQLSGTPGIDLRLNCVADAELIARLSPDVVISAVGAVPVVPNIQGIEGENVVLSTNLYDRDMQAVGEKVLIIGGGNVGCEIGIHMAMLGRQFEIVEMLDDYMVEDMGKPRRMAVGKQFQRIGYMSRCSLRCTRIETDGVWCEDKHGNEYFFAADTVIVSAGLKPNVELRESLRAACAKMNISFIPIGDCVRPDTVRGAVTGGFMAAVNLV